MPIHALETASRRPVATRDVLVIVEDPALRELIAAHLRHQGHIVLPAAGAPEACRLIAEVQPDLVLLDGDTASARDAALVARLQGNDDEPLPLVLLQSGADTTGPLAPQLRVNKPYRPQALAEAVHRLLQAGQPAVRTPLPTAGRLQAGLLELDFELRAVRRAGAPACWADLAPTELRLLQHLMQQPGRTHSRAELVAAVWGAGAEVDARTVDQYVRRLREALAAVQADSSLKTVRGVGYRIDLVPADAAT
ncbi:MAG: winged helix-turn-helix domain-containing protein [Burkholderiaceae bacterium]|nr:winged helix-turn-helix domain-containing protein [Rhodoferax sp.]MCP5286697.1 winged helix-turn-helix domain-containing protein [Burkholderiaceae bacterium]